MRRIIFLAGAIFWAILITVLVNLFKIPQKLGSDAITSWIDGEIAKRFSIPSPEPMQVVGFILEWAVPAIIAFGWPVAFALLYKDWRRKADDRSPLKITYPNEINSDRYASLYRESQAMLTSTGSTEQITRHKYYLGLYNKSYKTVKNASMQLLSLFPPGQPLDIVLPVKRTGAISVDIRPKSEELFMVFTGCDDSDMGMFQPNFLDAGEYTRFKEWFEKNKHFGGLLTGPGNSGVPILHNDGVLIEIRAHADDCAPVFGTMLINARSKLQLFIYRSNEIPKSVRKMMGARKFRRSDKT